MGKWGKWEMALSMRMERGGLLRLWVGRLGVVDVVAGIGLVGECKSLEMGFC